MYASARKPLQEASVLLRKRSICTMNSFEAFSRKLQKPAARRGGLPIAVRQTAWMLLRTSRNQKHRFCFASEASAKCIHFELSAESLKSQQRGWEGSPGLCDKRHQCLCAQTTPRNIGCASQGMHQQIAFNFSSQPKAEKASSEAARAPQGCATNRTYASANQPPLALQAMRERNAYI